ncbi:MAG: efflux RND transporter periplasmic adaptor subunit [Pseudomonadota bacterium]
MSRLLLGAIAVSLCLPAWAGHALVSVSPAQRTALRIATVPVSAHGGAVTVDLPATVRVPPEQERIVAAPVPGLITSVKVAVGDPVRAGQALAVLRSDQLPMGQRETTQAAVQLRLAEESMRRDEALFKEGIIPESRLQATRANLAQARAALQERRAWMRLSGLSQVDIKAVERGERLVDSIALTSPINGVVVEQGALAGSRAEPATPLFRVARLAPLWLEIQAPAEVAAQVKKGQKVHLRDSLAAGEVVSVGRSVDAAQTVNIRARVNNPGDQLRLNQSVMARVEGVAGAKQWRVPVRAIARHQGQSYVFVETPGGFEPVPVKVLSQTAQDVALDARFSGGERIAVEGVAALKASWQGMGGGE